MATPNPSKTPYQQQNRILGFDYGMRHIGVAIGQTLLRSATPLTTIKAKDGQPHWQDIDKLITEWQPYALLVGTPYLPNNPKHPIIKAASKFAQQLESRFNIPVYRMDEHLSTRAAWHLKTESPIDAHHGIDALSAKLIVESWLQQQTKELS